MMTSIGYLEGRTGASKNQIKYVLHTLGFAVTPLAAHVVMSGATELEAAVQAINAHQHDPRIDTILKNHQTGNITGRCACGTPVMLIIVGGEDFGWGSISK